MSIESADFIKAAITGAVGLAGTLLSIGVSWLKDRDDEAKRLRLLEASNKRLQFWELWLKVQLGTELDEVQKQIACKDVRNQIHVLKEIIERAFQLPDQSNSASALNLANFEKKREKLSHLRRFLLFYKPARSVAWLPRILFWLWFFPAPFSLALIFIVPSGIIPGLIGLLTTWGFWAISRAIEKPKSTTGISRVLGHAKNAS